VVEDPVEQQFEVIRDAPFFVQAGAMEDNQVGEK
jgi:hypothetical protein